MCAGVLRTPAHRSLLRGKLHSSQRLPGQETGNDGCCARLGGRLGKTSCWEGNVVCVECLKAGKWNVSALACLFLVNERLQPSVVFLNIKCFRALWIMGLDGLVLPPLLYGFWLPCIPSGITWTLAALYPYLVEHKIWYSCILCYTQFGILVTPLV